jgi:REP element-mobilizing transposase RayT
MPRGPRLDYPGALHHVYDRGAARRPIFENTSDVRAFLALVAAAVRSGLLDVHAYCVLTTHYHLLVGSPQGRLSDAMWRIQNLYVRRFNRGRRRDGPLMRARYGSRLVESASYFGAVVRYIDRNPVDAGLTRSAHRYPHGSARHFASPRRPPWLRTDAVEACVCDAASTDAFRPSLYQDFATWSAGAACELVERRIAAPPAPEDPLDDLVRAAPIEVQRWMERKASVADGTRAGMVLLAANTVLDVVDDRRIPDPPRRSLVAGILRDMTGVPYREIAARLGCSPATAATAARRHRDALRTDTAYAALAADVVHAVVRRDFGPPRRLFNLPRALPSSDIDVVVPA